MGAVLVKGSEVYSAYRGLEFPGDHAEFTLLQKKITSTSVTRGATLYTTLEPCTTRQHNRKPCAEWLLEKGIKRVVIGILDPNPGICGRGYWRLIENGVQVEFFPPRLAQRILEMNQPFFRAQRGSIEFNGLFQEKLQRTKDRLISPYPQTGVGNTLSLQECPNLREGWAINTVTMKLVSEDPFKLPTTYEMRFKEYFGRLYEEKRFMDDGGKFMLSRNPAAFSDSPSLVLDLLPTKYSVVNFYWDLLGGGLADCVSLIDEVVRGTLNARFAHAFCIHMILVTADNKILLTKRSGKVGSNQGLWSASAEEQLSRKDFVGPREVSALAWAYRLLNEELGLEKETCHKDNIRLLSVFLEAFLLNISACVYAETWLDERQLRFYANKPRTDNEIQDVDFLPFGRDVLLAEIFRPSRPYHPTSGYRFLMAFLKRFGAPSPQEIRRVFEAD